MSCWRHEGASKDNLHNGNRNKECFFFSFVHLVYVQLKKQKKNILK